MLCVLACVIIQCMTIDKSSSVGPVRIPAEHRAALDQLMEGKAHLSMSDLVREAIYRYLVERGAIKKKGELDR